MKNDRTEPQGVIRDVLHCSSRETECPPQIGSVNGPKESVQLTVVLEFLLVSLAECRDLADVVRKALQFYCARNSMEIDDINPLKLKGLLDSSLRLELEGTFSPAIEFLRRLDFNDSDPLELQLFSAVDRYLDAVGYTVPALCAFGEHLVSLCWHARKPNLYLALRDAIFIAPAVFAFAGEECRIGFLNFSRIHKRHGAKPEIYFVAGHKVTLADDPFLSGVIADVGLYGSLLDYLFDQGYDATKIGASFLASRNAFIYGFLNSTRENFSVDQVVAVADSIEALFKPWLTHAGTEGRIVNTLTDPLSFVLSCAFLWNMARHLTNRNGRRHKKEEVIDALRDGIGNSQAWFLQRPIEAWPEGPELLKKWKLKWPFLFPLDESGGLPISTEGATE